MNKILHLTLAIIMAIGLWYDAKAEIRQRINLPSSAELHCMYFDHNGLLWLGTSAGIMSYDGYGMRNEFTRDIPVFPQLIGDIRSLTSDHENHLWAGSNDGLLRIDLATGYIKLFVFPKQSQQIIYKLFISSNGTLYVGTDDGFSIYDGKKQAFKHFSFDNAKAIYPNGKKDRYKGWGVKDFVETKGGDIIIGTWSQGLWRFSPKTKTIKAYKKINEMNSAFALCIDKAGKLWIGSQGYGVQRLDNTADFSAQTVASIDRYNSRSVVYGLLQLKDGNMYACTGDTIGAQIGPDGAVWLALRQGGIVRVSADRTLFDNHNIGATRSIYTANGCQFLLGYGMAGLAQYDGITGSYKLNNMISGFEKIPADGLVTKVTSIIRRYNGDVWAAAGDNGVFIRHSDGTSNVLYAHSRQMPFVRDIVTALYEDSKSKALWIGQRKGISVLMPDGKGYYINAKNDSVDMTGYFMVNNITADHNGNIWVASANRGIVRISGNPTNIGKLKYKHFDTPVSNITACFEDSKHRMWAICPGGLLMYNTATGVFDMANKSFHLADRAIMSINEDEFGCLWLATDRALVRLDDKGNTISFTEQDGLASTAFFQSSTFRYGNRLFFGNDKGIVEFAPLHSYNEYRNYKSAIVITDIRIDGTSVLALDSADMTAITLSRPMATRQINVPASARTFDIAFALLNYASQSETKYAYMLKGVDEEWQYTDGNTHSASYSHIPAGNYTFMLKAADSHGHWQQLPYTITVKVAAPWYASWWAYLIYICMVLALARTTWRYIKMQQELEASRRYSSIVQSAQIYADHNANNADIANGNAETSADKPQAADMRAWAIQQRDAEFIAKATQLVNEHLADVEYNRDRMAADFNMSVSTLYGRMRDCTGLSIQNFIQTIRLNTAAKILVSEPLIRINELAYRVGFNTPKYFSQCFKKKFGVLPGDYVKGDTTSR